MTKAQRASRRAIAAQLRAQHRTHASKQPCPLCLVLELLEEEESRLDDALSVLDSLADAAGTIAADGSIPGTPDGRARRDALEALVDAANVEIHR